jgi:hypothetical protein
MHTQRSNNLAHKRFNKNSETPFARQGGVAVLAVGPSARKDAALNSSQLSFRSTRFLVYGVLSFFSSFQVEMKTRAGISPSEYKNGLLVDETSTVLFALELSYHDAAH